MKPLKIILIAAAFLSVFTSSFAVESYQGSGNESDNINAYMIYPEISSSAISFQLAKKRSFKITYGTVIDVASFSVVLNGKDISRRFHPVAGETENIFLPLHKGLNNLVLKISDYGNESAGVVPYWDIDEFIITLNKMEVIPGFSLTAPPAFENEPLPPMRTKNNNRP
jgi:hypothetical protein